MLKRILLYIKAHRCSLQKRMLLYVLVLLLPGCKPTSPPFSKTPELPAITQTSLLQTSTVASPTIFPTEVSLAARVGESVITMADYQIELGMFKAAKGTELAADDEKRVIDDLISQSLLSEAAGQNGFLVDDGLLEERIEGLIVQLGNEQALVEWMNANQLDDLSFRLMLQRSIAAAWMRDQIASSVPVSAEQVHARQILLYDEPTANDVYQQLQSGNSFRNLALKYDPVTGGDLGWFPRGYLSDKNIEEAAFSLEVEVYSSIIETVAGYHILQVMEKDMQRTLSPEALLALQTQAVQNWLDKQRSSTPIEIFVP